MRHLLQGRVSEDDIRRHAITAGNPPAKRAQLLEQTVIKFKCAATATNRIFDLRFDPSRPGENQPLPVLQHGTPRLGHSQRCVLLAVLVQKPSVHQQLGNISDVAVREVINDVIHTELVVPQSEHALCLRATQHLRDVARPKALPCAYHRR